MFQPVTRFRLIDFRLLVASFLLVAFFAKSGLATLPNLRARVTQRGLNYGAKLIVDFVTKNPEKVKMPDITVTVGNSAMTMSNMVIRRLPRPLLRIHLISNVTSDSLNESANHRTSSESFRGLVQANITNLNPTTDATLNIVQSWRLFHSEREVNITAFMRDMDLSLQFFIDLDEDGRPLPSDIQCHADGDVSFVLKGEFQRWNWFVSSVYNVMKNQFRETVFNQVCANLVAEMTKFVDNEMRNVSMTVNFGDDEYSFDYRLLTKPKITETFLETSHKGTVTSMRDSNSQEVYGPQIPLYSEQVEKMIYLYVTDSLANTMWYAAMSNGQLSYTVDDNTTDVTQTARSYLNTTCPDSMCIGTIFPHLALSHPNSVATVDIRAVNTSYVPFRFRGRTIQVRCKGIADLFIETLGVREEIFSVSLTLAGSLQLNISDQRLHFIAPANAFRLDGDILTTPNTFIGIAPLLEPVLDAYLTLLSNYVILPAIQAIGYQGLAIAVPNVADLHFINSDIDDQSVEPGQYGVVCLCNPRRRVTEEEKQLRDRTCDTYSTN